MEEKKTREGNTYLLDPESAAEMARLINQDRLITQGMGGALAGLAHPASLNTILDLGCGPGGWVLDVAFELPEAQVAGVDISRSMVDYANARARTQQLPNASFGVMNITEAFDFPDASFDLVNARYLLAVLRRSAWSPFLAECHRVLRPGGILRLSEPVNFGMTTSESVNTLMDLLLVMMEENQYDVSGQYPVLLPRQRAWMSAQQYQHIHLLAHMLDYSAATTAWHDVYHSIEIIASQMKPLLTHELIAQQDFEDLLQQVFIDLNNKEFSGLSHWTTLIGHKPRS